MSMVHAFLLSPQIPPGARHVYSYIFNCYSKFFTLVFVDLVATERRDSAFFNTGAGLHLLYVKLSQRPTSPTQERRERVERQGYSAV